MGNARARIAESLGELQALAGEIDAWYDQWDDESRAIGVIGKHWTQLELLAGVARNLIGTFKARVAAIDPAGKIEEVYAECRRADERLLYVRKLWRYYADKFDQRAGPSDGPMTLTLRAADEVIWSCWKTALKSLGADPEFYGLAPLAYLTPQFAASATGGTTFPSDLGRPPADEILARHVRQLPIPVIALPPISQRRPWWLVIAAHEVGHQVQWALPELEDQAKDAVAAAGDARWRIWHAELFADMLAVLLTGPAVIWAITELETRPAPSLQASLDSRYPPPAVRLAVAQAVADQVCLNSPVSERAVATPAPPRPGDEEAVEQLRRQAPAVAEALLSLSSSGGKELRGLAVATAGAYDEGVIGDWQADLLSLGMPQAERTLAAARFCVAGSVTAWQTLFSRDSSEQELADDTASLARKVLGVLPKCAEGGTRGPAGMDVKARAEDLARRFAADLHATDLLASSSEDVRFPGGAGQP
jgi:hypothetical protein